MFGLSCFFTTLFATYILYRIYRGCREYIHVLFGCKGEDITKHGTWAVVTGATNGMGYEYCHALAKMGLNVVLISRNMEKLENVATELEKDYDIETMVLQYDFTNSKLANYEEKLSKPLTELDNVAILVNNVGISYNGMKTFSELDNQFLLDIVNVNVVSMLMVTKYVLPNMMKRNKGIILNMSSVSALIEMPYLTAYSASKSFVNCYSVGLSRELHKTNIIVECVSPSFIAGKMSGIKKPSLMVPSNTQMINQILNSIGICYKWTNGWFPHFLQYLHVYLPESVKVYFYNKGHIKSKAYMLRKKNR
ncbi:hypothetical protein A3Q56_06225 [Intoshia linei]|uniref:Uncharacterized protein n=1 Tax=Intoshia linei TaxID=1819745 RepID=A0A177AXC3_9BILA|nr:hypothetical protein A3Q56_06225 [Intoshia linei]